MKFTFTIRLDTGLATHEEKLVIAGNKGEMIWHIALKLLGYLLFFEHRPRIEVGIGHHYKPDLVATDLLDPEGRLTLWVDCGNIAVKKIDKVATMVRSTDARFVILRRTVRDVERLERGMAKKVKHLARVALVAFDDGFVDALAEWFDGTNELDVRRTHDALEVVLANRRGKLERRTALHRKTADE